MKQEFIIIALEGIRSFDPSKGVKLSTFLHIHLDNKIISKIKTKNKKSKDACTFTDDPEVGKYRRVKEELSFNYFTKEKNSEGGKGLEPDEMLAEREGVYGGRRKTFNDVDFELSIQKVSSKLDYSTRKIIELIYFEDYSIIDAANEVGLTGWAASTRLKQLAKKRSFQTIFEQLNHGGLNS